MQRICRGFLSYLSTLLIVAVSFVLVTIIKKWQENEVARMQSLNVQMTLIDKGLMRFISILSSAFVVIINTSMIYAVRLIS